MELDASLKIYTNNYTTYQNLKDTYFFYEKLTNVIQDETKNEQEKSGLNYRKTYYEQQAIENATNFFTILLVLYIIVAFVTLITLFRNPDTGKFTLLFALAALIIFPIFSVAISVIFLQIWKFILSFMPKNVYHSL